MIYYRDPKKICSTIGLGLFMMLVVWLFVSSIAQGIVLALQPAALYDSLVIWLLNDIPLYGVAAPVFLLILRSIPDGPAYARPRVRLGAGRLILVILFCFGAMYLCSFISASILQFLQQLFSGGYNTDGLVDSLFDGSNFLTNLIFGACIPALGEEYLFRHVLRRKMRGCADLSYILVSGLCFSLFHANFSQLFYAFVLGAAFAWLYLITNNIWLPVSLHFIINLMGGIVMPAAFANENTYWLAQLFILLTIPAALILFFANLRKIRASLLPPTEPGWPYNMPTAGLPGTAGAPPRWAMTPQQTQPWPVQQTQPWPAQQAQPWPAQQTQPWPAQPAQPAQPWPVQQAQPWPAQQTQPWPPQPAQPWPAYAMPPATAQPLNTSYATPRPYTVPPPRPAAAHTPYPVYAAQHQAAARTPYPAYTPPQPPPAPTSHRPQRHARAATPPYPYPYAPPKPRRQRPLGYCLANPGMVLYLVLAGLLTLLMMAATLLTLVM